MSPQAHARVDEKHFDIVGPAFSNTVGESEAVFIFRKLSVFLFVCLFVYKCSVPITEAVCCHIFKSFCNGGIAKVLRQVVCKLVSTKLYCACASADIVPLSDS